ncbi:pilus assembly PilX family protein [Pseudomonas tolaasii]|uniref:pilus assembly PilX family protein n=1 Tax=Pseudomonas tolaasii TaxID=29442 RepID=UPI001C5F7795|nr:PilX N-terminal domain-containing pilus assembly protein [Pseudomonas tolaasii]MBW4794626.1 pilus assembly protein PilX [Pseudomonas tolaasii]
MRFEGMYLRQAGMVLLISLVFLLALSLIGLASMQGALSQQKIAGSFWHRNQSFQTAESGLSLGAARVRTAGGTLPLCLSIHTCAPPEESHSVVSAGTNPVSSVSWVPIKGGLYGVQSLGQVDRTPGNPAALYRVTAVGFVGQSRTVLEAVYAQAVEGGSAGFRRVLWRQLQ